MKGVLRTTMILICVAGGFLVAATPADATDPGVRECVHRDPQTGDITVSPSGCEAQLDPVRQVVYEQCEWITSNPAVPPIIACAPPDQ